MPVSEPLALSQAWAAFDHAAEAASRVRIADLFAAEPDRLSRLSVAAAGITLDLSKQPWSAETLEACLALARAAGVEAARDRLFAGEAVNTSENRAVLHPALRARSHAYCADGDPVSGDVKVGWAKMKALADGVRSGVIAATGKPFKTIVHIGIGGSDLGPRLIWEAFKPLDAPIDLRFVANVDGAEIAAALAGLDPESTFIIAVSKTFTTLETLANAEAARDWLREALGEDAARKHVAAVSAAPDKAVAFGVDPDRVFAFWDWVGGRFSVWSAVGLSCAIALGWDVFAGFLEGAETMDQHFLQAPLSANAPVLLALAQVLNRDGLGRGARAVAPYAQRLRLLPAFLQQLEMESNGKRIRKDGHPVLRATAPVVFGDAGTNGQHAFFQLLHQGVDVIPVEFVAVAHADEGPDGMHAKLLSNVIAQAEALMIGRSEADVRQDLQAKGAASDEIDGLAPQRAFPGNRPSSFLLMDRLTPQALGALLALYEHKVFVEGTLWGINSFDQWGVELGKSLASRVLGELNGGTRLPHDPSTTALIDRLKVK
jgi:glucose-6-phosphate isomerase